MITYNEHEMKKIRYHFPHLYYESGIIKGIINFNVSYELKQHDGKQIYLIVKCLSEDSRISNEYQIEIHLKDIIPVVYEVGGKIEALAKKRGYSIEDLHFYQNDKRCCLGIFSPRYINSLSEFVIEWVYPFFVWQAYWEKYDKIPPCDAYSHGRKGYLEKKLELEGQLVSSDKKYNRNATCPCGLPNKYKKCCLPHDEKLNTEISYINNMLREYPQNGRHKKSSP